MKLSPRLQFALLGGSLVLLVAFVLMQGGPAAPAEQPRLTSEGAAPAPSADNVAPAFHTRLMALKQRVEEAPADTAALLELARLQQDAHQLEDAAASYEQLLEVAPDHRQARLDLALVYAEAGRPDDALRVTEALLDRYPDDPAGLYNLGALHANAGRYDEARGPWGRVAAQTQDAALAEQARTSLAQLDALASGAASPAGPAPGAAPTPAAAPGTVPPGHPPLPAFEPILVER
ncbi:MAG TPA: tetratricopeptide repeat protein [Rubricoccaceae bacterium]|nr:tetratricopeptide repeat protein [Rubricoccaceae bacterium]